MVDAISRSGYCSLRIFSRAVFPDASVSSSEAVCAFPSSTLRKRTLFSINDSFKSLADSFHHGFQSLIRINFQDEMHSALAGQVRDEFCPWENIDSRGKESGDEASVVKNTAQQDKQPP
ncbi:MAG: hypothetical protein MZV70_63960 [Desulfobacterales bacterium]|nr:hypothetical protein [Desulfobacterales bacterium]